jgi:hypothetical protein
MPPPAATQAAARLWTQPTLYFPARLSYRSSVEIKLTLWWQTRFTRGRVREWKSGHNSVTVQNRTHIYINFFDHKDLGNHLLQLCPEVVKHHVYRRILIHKRMQAIKDSEKPRAPSTSPLTGLPRGLSRPTGQRIFLLSNPLQTDGADITFMIQSCYSANWKSGQSVCCLSDACNSHPRDQ